jgi:3-oxocholest-4-en-26-oyl-CoA dehydrogenase beta subunit
VRAMESNERGYTAELWRSLAGLGWLRLPLPAAYGGEGQDFVTLALLLEEMGRACLPGPYVTTVVLCGQGIAEFGSEAQRRRWLPAIGEGSAVLALAHVEPNVKEGGEGVQLLALPEGDGFRLNGTKLFVPYANSAAAFLVTARVPTGASGRSGITCFLVDAASPGLGLTALKTMNGEPQYELSFSDVSAPAGSVVGGTLQGLALVERIEEWGAVAACLLMCGAAQAMLEMTVDYAKDRVAFGRPIGSFQAIQHHCANMAVDVDSSLALTYQAAWYVSERLKADVPVAMAKGWVSDVIREVYALAHQCHGAIGLTKEYDLQLYSRRCKAWELFYGDHSCQQERLAAFLGFG